MAACPFNPFHNLQQGNVTWCLAQHLVCTKIPRERAFQYTPLLTVKLQSRVADSTTNRTAVLYRNCPVASRRVEPTTLEVGARSSSVTPSPARQVYNTASEKRRGSATRRWTKSDTLGAPSAVVHSTAGLTVEGRVLAFRREHRKRFDGQLQTSERATRKARRHRSTRERVCPKSQRTRKTGKHGHAKEDGAWFGKTRRSRPTLPSSVETRCAPEGSL